MKSREWHLVRRPVGRPTRQDVALVEVVLPDPGEGEVLVENLVMSVEPYMRGRMDAGVTYAEPYPLDAPMSGRAVGRVRRSRVGTVPEGALVLTDLGWREHVVTDAASCTVLADTGLSPSVHLGPLGIPGMTAWVGLEKIAALRPGEVVFVNSAAGAVGSTVVEIARARDCTVIGSAGGAEKTTLVTEHLGAHAAFDHRAGPARRGLAEAMDRAGVEGLDVVFDNVGGDQLEAAIRVLRPHARVALCGMLSIYNATEPVPGPRNLLRLIWTRSRMEGFLVGDHDDARPEFENEMVPWLRSGTVTGLETSVPGGIEAAFDAFLQMLDGQGVGKLVVPITE